MRWEIKSQFFSDKINRAGMLVQGANRLDSAKIEKAIVLPLGAEESVDVTVLKQWLDGTGDKQAELCLSTEELEQWTPAGRPSVALAIVGSDNAVVFYRIHSGLVLPSKWLTTSPAPATNEDEANHVD